MIIMLFGDGFTWDRVEVSYIPSIISYLQSNRNYVQKDTLQDFKETFFKDHMAGTKILGQKIISGRIKLKYDSANNTIDCLFQVLHDVEYSLPQKKRNIKQHFINEYSASIPIMK